VTSGKGFDLRNFGVERRSDVFYLYTARAARGFGDGFAATLLPAYLIEIGINPFEIGVVAKAALLGSAALTPAIGLLAPRCEFRTLLLICALLMVVTGIAFPAIQQRANRCVSKNVRDVLDRLPTGDFGASQNRNIPPVAAGGGGRPRAPPEDSPLIECGCCAQEGRLASIHRRCVRWLSVPVLPMMA
jgi:hypothetical protein